MNLRPILINKIHLRASAIALPSIATSIAITLRYRKKLKEASRNNCLRETAWDKELENLRYTVTGYELREGSRKGVAYNLNKYVDNMGIDFDLLEYDSSTFGYARTGSEKDSIQKIDSRLELMVGKLEAFTGPELNENASADEKLLAVNLGFFMLRIYHYFAEELIGGPNIAFEEKEIKLNSVFEDLRKIGASIELQINDNYHNLLKEKMLLDSELKKPRTFRR